MTKIHKSMLVLVMDWGPHENHGTRPLLSRSSLLNVEQHSKGPKVKCTESQKAMAAMKGREKTLYLRQGSMVVTNDDKLDIILKIHIKHPSILTRALGVRESRISPALQLSKLHSRLSNFPILSQAANVPVSKDLAGLNTPRTAKSETFILNALPPSSTWKISTAFGTGARVHHARNKIGQKNSWA